MTQAVEPRRAIIPLAVGVCTIVGAMLAFGITKKTGILDPDLARRGAAAMLGLMLVVMGNYTPKLRLFQPAGEHTGASAVDRFAGWTFVVAGLAFVAIWLFAPIDKAMLASPMIGVAGFLVVLARWLAWGERAGGTASVLPRPTPVRTAVFILLVSLLWTFAIFFADTIWGDRVAQWMAMGLIIVIAAVAPFIAVAMRRASNP
ncbi:hypothetical protein D1224_06285 [Henriciella barbarensis]|uniref:Uncharacterized protein n=1 Tax=Henriciella barbarensis TaxID=86342 RepID=A0A399QY62_9PROT|nr:hypothetical protein [Henriciella barbarensis]RIJ23858.1 hypothetical protein D1224_06285 [Henriciella barbarensis]